MFVWKRLKIKEEEAGNGPFFKKMGSPIFNMNQPRPRFNLF